MARRFGSVGIVVLALSASGCLLPQSAPFEVPYDRALAPDLMGGPLPVLARSQLPEAPLPSQPLLKPPTESLPGLLPPTLPARKEGPGQGLNPPPLLEENNPPVSGFKPPLLPPETLPVSVKPITPSRVSIRAHVNGKPIFDDEIMQFVAPAARYYQNLPPAKRQEKVAEVYNQILEKIIEDEVMYQDAVKKLEKVNRVTLDKLKSLAAEELEKVLRRYRDEGAPEEALKALLPTMQKNNERNFIATEYIRSRVLQWAQSRVGHQEIQEYYELHKKENEFQKFDSVKWQDVFIQVGPQRPTLAAARRHAEDLVATCRTSGDFVKLLPHDEGDAKLRNGEGIGQRRADIRPIGLADTLFAMKEGQIEIVDFGTGVHIVRLVQREMGGQIPLNEATQKLIRRKLTDQIIAREYQRIVRELRQRSVIEYEAAN